LQNAVDHGFPEGSGGGHVVVKLSVDDVDLHISVVDDGRGIPEGFKFAEATGLGLSIVRTLVTTELAGEIEMRPATEKDLEDVGLVVTSKNTGTVVTLRVPLEND
jgi:two-component sensor histidine kinase